MIELFAIWPGKHRDRIASKVLVKAPGCAAAAEHMLLVHRHRIVFVVEIGVELLAGLSGGEREAGRVYVPYLAFTLLILSL